VRAPLSRLLGEGGELRSSYLPGRSGFLIRSQRPLADLRRDLRSRGWACRLYPIHAEGGRHFLEPSAGWLAAALRSDRLEWWSPEHATAAATFFTAPRRDRIRRLPAGGSGGQAGKAWTRGFLELRGLALRLEALPVSRRPDKQWRGLAEAFDRWWRGNRLYAVPSSELSEVVVGYLRAVENKVFARGSTG
jgi:hypothetical protein